MSYETQARTQLGYQSDYELQRFTTTGALSDPGLQASPLSDGHLQELAQDVLDQRREERIAAAEADLELRQDPLEDL